VTPFALRPLSLGELFDRAITLCVRSFAVLAVILALVDIPLNAFELVTDPTPPDRLSDIVTTLRHVAAAIPNGPPDGTGRKGGPSAVPVPDVRLMAVDLGEALLAQLATLACAAAAVRAYFGQRPSVLWAYRKALRRFPALLASDGAAAGVAIALVVVGLPAGIIVALALAALAAAAGGFVFFSVAAASIGFGLLCLLAALVNFASLMMLASIAFDDEAPLRSGLRRTFGAGTRRRSACAAAIVLAVSWGGWLVGVAAGDGLSAFTHNAACSAVLQSLADAGSNALSACFAVTYAFDVRIRREGFDLAVAAGEPVGDFPPPHPNASPT
jgi:hypothetical protein